MTKNKRKRVRTKTKLQKGDDVCWNKKYKRWAKHNSQHERFKHNWDCKIADMTTAKDIISNATFSSIWDAKIYTTPKIKDG